MKIPLRETEEITGPDGHGISELIGLSATNTSRYSVAHMVAPAGSRGTTRRNRFDEILIVKSGTGSIIGDYGGEAIGPDDVVLLPAGTTYAIEANSDSDLTVWAICVPAFRPEWSETGSAKSRDWRDYQVPRGTERLRPSESADETTNREQG